MPISIRLLLGLCLLPGLVDNLSEERRTKASTKAHPSGNACKPRLGRAPKRVWKNYRRLETPTYLVRDFKERFIWRERDEFIDFRNPFPEGLQRGGSQYGKPGVRTTALEGAHGALALQGLVERVG